MKKSIFSILLLLFAVVVQAQIQEPVKFIKDFAGW